MSLSSLILAGMPPVGLGIYLRDTMHGAPFAFRVVNASRSDARELVARARELGPVWLYSGPDSWAPRTWQRGLEHILDVASKADVEGIIADPEGGPEGQGWPDLPQRETEREARALGEALRAASSSTRVGFTSYPSWRELEVIVDAAGSSVWGSPQLYGRTAEPTPATLAAWWSRWHALLGVRCIPSIAAWNASEAHDTREEFARYLAAVPRASGAIAWPGTGPLPTHIAAELASYQPGGSSIGTVALAALSFGARVAGIVVIVVGLFLVALVVAVAVRV